MYTICRQILNLNEGDFQVGMRLKKLTAYFLKYKEDMLVLTPCYYLSFSVFIMYELYGTTCMNIFLFSRNLQQSGFRASSGPLTNCRPRRNSSPMDHGTIAFPQFLGNIVI